MKYRYELGIFEFKENEDDIAFIFMWECLMDTTFRAKIETIWRMFLKKPPKRYWDIQKLNKE